jgi:hypothetical protein
LGVRLHVDRLAFRWISVRGWVSRESVIGAKSRGRWLR